MKSHRPRKTPPAARRTGKKRVYGRPPAKMARKSNGRAVKAENANPPGSEAVHAAAGLPAATPSPEKAAMRASTGTNMFSLLLSMQFTWMKFGFAQARMTSMAMERLSRSRSRSSAAGRDVAAVTAPGASPLSF